jgi:drug/metabolite transporter (DMT)-like permease
MNWLGYSVTGALLSSLWSLSVKKGLTSIFSTDFVSWYAIVSLLVTTLFNVIRKVSFDYNLFGLIAGVCQAICGITLTKSFATSPNPGLTMAVFRTQAIITTVMAFFLFHSNITVSKIVAMGVVVAGVYLLSKTKPKDDKETPEEFKNPEQAKSKKNSSKMWLWMALLGGLVMSCKDILTKKALVADNKGVYNILFNSVLAQGIVLLIYDRITTGSFRVTDINGDGEVDWKDYLTIGWTGVIFAAYMLTVISATQTAPNVGYAKAIDTLGVIITSISSHFIFGSELTKESLGGIAMVISGVLYISIAK